MTPPSHSLRIAHLSDLHAPPNRSEDYFGLERVTGALLSDLKAQHQERPVDLIVFSGDLSYDGTAQALHHGKELLLDPLRSTYRATPIVLTPGNHDVDRDEVDPVTDIGLRGMLTSSKAVRARLDKSDKASEARAPLKAWDRLVEKFDPGLETQHLPPYGRAYRLKHNDVSLAIGSFDSAWRSQGGAEDKGHLIVGADYVRSFLEANRDADIALVTFHHPLDWLVEFDAAELRVALERSQTMVLTGHDHIPNPTLEVTTRGSALYCRAPCSYADTDYGNGYALIDLDLARGRTVVRLRRWSQRRDEFGADTETVEGGVRTFHWPKRESEVKSAFHLPDPTVLQPISRLASERSVIPSEIEDGPGMFVSDFIVPPRFWPVPHAEVMDRTLELEERPKERDPLKEAEDRRVVIVSGPPMSGVTFALLWLLELHYRQLGTHVPQYVKADSSFNLKGIRAAIEGARASFMQTAELETRPSVIVAIDDVPQPLDAKAARRIARLLEEDEDVVVVLGCHDDRDTVGRALEPYEIKPGRLYLGPFGRSETVQLVIRVAGPENKELVDNVLQVARRQGLPRYPLNLAALITEIQRNSDLKAINESGLLESIVNRLLTQANPESTGKILDDKPRDYLLGEIAREVVESERQRIPRGEIEQLVLQYYAAVGQRSMSAGHIIDGFIDRKVLEEDTRGVGFRYPSFLHLFAAKATFENHDFAQLVFDDLLTYAPIVEHVAGLKMTDKQTLERVIEEAGKAREQMLAAGEVGPFSRIEDEHGWSRIRDLQDARSVVQQRPEPRSDKEWQEIDEDSLDPDAPSDGKPFPETEFERPVDQLAAACSLAASVLQSSEYVKDIELRTRGMREVITGWTTMTVLFATEEKNTRELIDLLQPLFATIEDATERESRIEHMVRLFVISLMCLSLYVETGTAHHAAVLENLLEDPEFMADTGNALFATMLYAMLHLREWVQRLTNLYERHGDHPMVREVVRRWSLEEYYTEEFAPEDDRPLEDFLVRILIPEETVDVEKRASQNSKVREELRKTRTKLRWASHDFRRPPDEDD